LYHVGSCRGIDARPRVPRPQGLRPAQLPGRAGCWWVSPVMAMYGSPAAAKTGGLISYGADSAHTWRQAGVYVGRVLKGEKPTDLPIIQPTKFDLTVNLKSA
jgi:hypothetical protein